MRPIINGFVKQTMGQSRTDEYADEQVNQQRFELTLRVAYSLAAIVGVPTAEKQPDGKQNAVPTESDAERFAYFGRGVPRYEKQIFAHFTLFYCKLVGNVVDDGKEFRFGFGTQHGDARLAKVVDAFE